MPILASQAAQTRSSNRLQLWALYKNLLKNFYKVLTTGFEDIYKLTKKNLALPLLMLGVCLAYNKNATMASNYCALLANFFNRCAYFHSLTDPRKLPAY
ncbi:MAG: hypothetical protein A3B96_03470 [Candidatus Spechtbacteria bacterium RIFCSPHIGHO2_02_FULL_43_15b]|uniref:Uncharacterized protein n=1 Tax=Candidatus Spechtbacteria bacterium RIFCSPHIGHO2_01_FULL_43_30 TaxID=1802158 RepID=A0A1G2H6Z6_9BACT|nr:MAG: hypothetical protein A2827_02375 [Candidatus Spechtbacteria bacterium RIFCSPHIGHO2_01_FULL_43_30]OGZ59408.1 MAG: hypothetical protein A3B96_03470 [Candidatus Spechtbacteria bacterium RIFCSPHIGHO2_02_FULL_43_15b]